MRSSDVPGIATVADLRASSLSAVMNPTRGTDPETCTEPRYCWLYHVGNSYSLSLFLFSVVYQPFLNQNGSYDKIRLLENI